MVGSVSCGWLVGWLVMEDGREGVLKMLQVEEHLKVENVNAGERVSKRGEVREMGKRGQNAGEHVYKVMHLLYGAEVETES